MCEFTVFLESEIVFRDATYAKAEANRVLLRDVLGKSKTIEHCKVAEVDVASQRLILAKA